MTGKRSKGKTRKKAELVEPENDGAIPRDWVNDPFWLRTLLHRTFDLLPKDFMDAVSDDADDAACVQLVTDVNYIFEVEKDRDYVVFAGDVDEDLEGHDDDEEDEEDEGDEEEDEEDEDESD